MTRAEPERHLGLLWWSSEDAEQSAVDLELEPIDDNRTLVRVTETRATESVASHAGGPQACATPFGSTRLTRLGAARV